MMQQSRKLFSTQNLVKMGLLSAMAFVLMRTLEIPLPIFPSFLKLDFGDMPAVIASLAIHPFAGIVVIIMKNLLALMNSSSGGVGEIANAIVGISFILPIALLTRHSYHIKRILTGCLIGIIGMMIAGVITNALITMPLYGEEACIAMGSAINPHIVDKWTFLLYVMVPFNFIKGVVVSAISLVTIRGIEPLLKNIRLRKL